MDRSGREYVASVTVARSADDLYAMVSDVTQMGKWSPECTGATWDQGAGPEVGATFTGHNRSPQGTWHRRCRVVTATPPAQFAWIVGYGDLSPDDEFTYWGYEFEPVDGGTRVTETWKVLKESHLIAALSDAEWEDRLRVTIEGIDATLVRFKEYAEALPPAAEPS